MELKSAPEKKKRGSNKGIVLNYIIYRIYI